MATSLRHHQRTQRKEVDFRGEKRSNQTHASTTDPDARLYRKGSGMEAKLSFIGHALMEKPQRPLRRGTADQCIGSCRETGRARHDRALCRPSHFDHAGRRQGLRCRWLHPWSFCEINVTPHVAQNTTRRSAIDRRIDAVIRATTSASVFENGSKRASDG